MDPILLLFSAYLDAAQSVRISCQSNLVRYSQYTVITNKLFVLLWVQFSGRPSAEWRYPQFKNVYWNAAVSYEATIAWIDGAEVETKDEEPKVACNLAIAAALGSRDPVVIAERDRVCGG